jgi:hypothetical protein
MDSLFLIGFALSNRLSLDVRLRAIRFLHRLDSGQMLLKRLLDTESELTIVRAAAAYQFVHYPQAVPFLQSYVSYQHPPLLRRAVVPDPRSDSRSESCGGGSSPQDIARPCLPARHR